MCTIANRALFDDLRADAEAAQRALDADARAAAAALDAEYGAADNRDGDGDGTYDEEQFLRASALLAAAATDGAAEPNIDDSDNPVPAAPSSPAASSVKSFAVSERHHGRLYFPEERERHRRQQRPRDSPLRTTSPTRTSPVSGRPWPPSPASPPATTTAGTDGHAGATSPVSRENPLRVVRVPPSNRNHHGRPPASPITPRSGGGGAGTRQRRRPRGRSAGSVSSNSSRRHRRRQDPGHNSTWEEASEGGACSRFGGGGRTAHAWDGNPRTVEVLGRSGGGGGGGGGGAAGSGPPAPPADLALAREEQMFARARARDQRLVDAKRRREEVERARLARIESQIEGRTQRASVALRRVERKAELERELRLLERQERTERNMQSYWDRRRQRVLKTVSRTSGVYDGADGEDDDDDVENAQRRNGGSSRPRARHTRSAGPTAGARRSVLLGPVGRTGAAAHHDQQLDMIRRISQREESRVGSIITNAALHDARVDSMLDKRAQARQRQADYRAKMARSKAGLVPPPAGKARRRNDAAVQRFKQRETVAEFARRRARSGLSTAGAALMACGGHSGDGVGHGNVSPRSSVSARSPRSPRYHNSAHATVHSPRYSPRSDVPRRSDPRFRPEPRPQPPPSAPAYTLAASQPGSHPPENPLAQYQRLSEGGPPDTLPPQQHAAPTDWNPGQNAGPSWTDKVARHRQQQEAGQRQRDAVQRQHAAQRRQQQAWEQEERQRREEARRTAPDRAREARAQAVLADSYGVPCWYYVDSQGVTQGPFDDRQMRQWSVNGYFTDNLKMKRGAAAAFVPLGEIFPNAEVAFCPGCGPCPVVE